jgi:uncharacterized membrane protein YfcA
MTSLLALAWRLLPLCAVGLGVGVLAGTFGIGGGVLAIPSLSLLLGLDQHMAQGTSLASIVPTAALAAYRYARRGSLRPGAALRLGAAALVVGFAAARLSLALPSRLLRGLFAAFVVFLAWRSLRPAASRPQPARDRAAEGDPSDPPGPTPPCPPPVARTAAGRGDSPGDPLLLGIGGLVGGLAGLLGVGGGAVATPLLVLLCGFPQQVAQGTTLAVIVLSASSGLVGYALAGRVDWVAAAALFAGAALTVPVGASLAHRLPEAALRRIFAVFLTLVAAVEAMRAI